MMANAIWGLKNPPRLLATLALLVFQSQVLPLTAQTYAPKQHFVCNTGYTPQECQAATTVLRKAQARYPVDALGEWTWVLVRTVDWKQILSDRKLDTNRPAFSYLPKRETFLDGALVVRGSIRGAELRAIWHMPIEDLLDLAIRHELAHAVCNDPDETKAERAAIALKNGTPLSCRVIEQATTANPKPATKQSDHKAEATITLRVYDFAHPDPDVLADTKKVTTEIFRKAGVKTVWLDCPAYQADCGPNETEHLQFMLRILAPAMDKDMVAKDALGFAIPCHADDRGCLCYIFYSRISTLAAEHGISPGRILGHVMAHEIGHALLGPDAHEVYGVMQAQLAISGLEWKTLYFTSAQSRRLRAELLARNSGSEQIGNALLFQNRP